MSAKLDLKYPAILDLFPEHLDPKRTESASFLVWYLENYYRLDTVDAIDSVCDQKGDKGVDGIYINESEACVYVFQSRISQKAKSSVGDASLKEFQGTLSQFKDDVSIQNLLKSAGKADVANLIRRLDLVAKRKTHTLKGIFLTNVDIDANGKAFINCAPELVFVGEQILQATYISDERNKVVATTAEFDVSGFSVSEYIVDAHTKSLIAPIKAAELTALRGIADQSLFDYNVRGSLGNTQVNRDIVSSIKDPGTHKLFPLFHNGITVICESLESTADKIKIGNYYVVNGCQSLTALYENRSSLTGDLRVLTKFAKMDVPSALATQVSTHDANGN
ncbi:MAG: AIPR family protein [Limisphaerales bacterium]